MIPSESSWFANLFALFVKFSHQTFKKMPFRFFKSSTVFGVYYCQFFWWLLESFFCCSIITISVCIFSSLNIHSVASPKILNVIRESNKKKIPLSCGVWFHGFVKICKIAKSFEYASKSETHSSSNFFLASSGWLRILTEKGVRKYPHKAPI